METIQSLINAILQLIFFTLLPFIWWFIKWRKQSNFLYWLGIKKPKILNNRRYFGILIVDFILMMVVLFVVIPFFIDSNDLATSEFAGMGLSALIPGLIYSFIETGLSEEIFFRGFLAKRLINKFGLKVGNFAQGLLFGLLHGFIFMNFTGALGVIAITIITGFTGWLLGLLNEKYSNGSIVSSWLIHGLSNLFASLLAMFGYL